MQNDPYIQNGVKNVFGDPTDIWLSKFMGRGYVFKMPEKNLNDPRRHKIDKLIACKKFSAGI